MAINIPIWLICIIGTGILAYLGEKEEGYFGGFGHALGILALWIFTIAYYIGKWIG